MKSSSGIRPVDDNPRIARFKSFKSPTHTTASYNATASGGPHTTPTLPHAAISLLARSRLFPVIALVRVEFWHWFAVPKLGGSRPSFPADSRLIFLPRPNNRQFASGIMGIFLSMLVDLILLMRLVSAYLGRVGTGRFALVVSLPVFLKVARTINVIIFLKILCDITRSGDQDVITAYFTLPYLKIEWVAQVVDNSYASVMFLWTIYGQRTITECTSGGSSSVLQPSLVHRVRILFRIAVFNFVIPTLFSIVQLIISFQNVFSVYVGDVIYVNGMVSVYGVVFASVWAGKESLRNWKEAKQYWEHNNNNNNNQSRHNRYMMEGDNDVEGGGEAWKEAGCSTSESAAVIRQTAAVDDSRSEVLDSTLEEAERGFARFAGEDGLQLSVR